MQDKVVLVNKGIANLNLTTNSSKPINNPKTKIEPVYNISYLISIHTTSAPGGQAAAETSCSEVAITELISEKAIKTLIKNDYLLSHFTTTVK